MSSQDKADRYLTTRRRKFLKTAGVGMATGLAGCTGDGDGGDGDGGTTDTPGDGDGMDFSGVELTWWNSINVQSGAARSNSEALIQEFEQDTGASISASWDGYGDIIGANWREGFQNGNYPVMYDSFIRWDGQFIDGDWVLPFDDYRDRLSQETIDAIEWIFPVLESQFAGFERDIYEIPYGFVAGPPVIARMDHFDEAGLSRDRLPAEGYEDFIDIATTLQEDGPADHGMQIHGTVFDATDCFFPQMLINEHGKDGLWMNSDWSDTQWDSDPHKEWARNWVDIYTEHGLSNPATPDHDDESVTAELVAQGQYSMSTADFFNHPDYAEANPDLYESGDIQWFMPWDGASSFTGKFTGLSFAITQAPEGADQSEYERKQDAAIEFLKRLLSKDVQRNLFDNFGLMPIRQDVWGEVGSHPSGLFDAIDSFSSGDGPHAWSAHPASVSIQYNIPGPELQDALRGNQTPEEACDSIAAQIRDQLL